jgi:AcrR family transcriptional regulator
MAAPVRHPPERSTDRPSDRPRSRNPRGEGERLRIDLLDAAAELIAETGDVEKVSLRAVANRVGVSPTAVYRHFDDHIALLHEAVTHCWAEFAAALASASTIADPCARLRAMGTAYTDFAVEQHGKYTVLFSNTVDLRDRPHDDAETFGSETFVVLVDLVGEILAANGDERDPYFVAVQVHTWIHGIVDLTCRNPAMWWPPVEELLDDLLVRLGLTPQPAP